MNKFKNFVSFVASLDLLIEILTRVVLAIRGDPCARVENVNESAKEFAPCTG